MRKELLELFISIYNLAVCLKAAHEAADRAGVSHDDVTFPVDLEDDPKWLREAILKWTREKGCPVDEVPTLRAIEARLGELRAEFQKALYHGKEDPIIADSEEMRSLIEQIAGTYETGYETPEHLADYITVELLAQSPEIVKRMRKVRPLVLVQGVPPELARRYREAARSYFFRNPLACCAMCRAVVELALAEACEDRLRLNPDSFTLGGLIDSLEKAQVLSTDAASFCREVKRNGDSSMHSQTIFQSDAAYRSLECTQRILKFLYSS